MCPAHTSRPRVPLAVSRLPQPVRRHSWPPLPALAPSGLDSQTALPFPSRRVCREDALPAYGAKMFLLAPSQASALARPPQCTSSPTPPAPWPLPSALFFRPSLVPGFRRPRYVPRILDRRQRRCTRLSFYFRFRHNSNPFLHGVFLTWSAPHQNTPPSPVNPIAATR